jgi:hypothetical protein
MATRRQGASHHEEGSQGRSHGAREKVEQEEELVGISKQIHNGQSVSPSTAANSGQHCSVC